MRRRIWSLGMVVMLSTLAACSGGGHKAAKPPPTPGPNPDVIPAVITPAYVNAVFRVLNHVYGNAIRSWLASGHETSSARADLRAVFGDPLYGQELSITTQGMTGDLTNVRKPPGDRITSVRSLIDESQSCVFVETLTDYSQVLVHDPRATGSEYWRLSPKVTANDPGSRNPTPWALTFNATYTTTTPIPDQCSVASS